MQDKNQSRVRTDIASCEKMAKLIRRIADDLGFPRAEEDEIQHSLPDAVIKNLYFAVIAICHQTTPHNRPRLEGRIGERVAVGWDYLLNRWILAVQQNHELVTPKKLSGITGSEIEDLLRDSERGSTVTDSSGRAGLLNNLGQVMIRNSWTNVQQLLEETDGRIVQSASGPGLLDKLREFEAYGADPVQKKSFYFLSLMLNQGLWSYTDPANLGAPVDYHEVRGHLRYGTVDIVDQELRGKLLERKEVSSADDIEIRSAVFAAIKAVSQMTGITPNDLHYFFWNMFRNCCQRNETHCDSCRPHSSLPERYARLKPDRCIFAEHCRSVSSAAKLSDHLIDTVYY